MNPLLRMITKRRGTAKYYHLGAWVLWLDARAFLAGSQDGSLGLEWAGEEVLAGWRHGGKIKLMMMMMSTIKMMRMTMTILIMIETTLAWPMPEIKTAAITFLKIKGENGRSVQRCWIYNRVWGGNSISFAQVTFTENLSIICSSDISR